ncbi:hypothetical protein B2J93_1749 [Marssonina coronariae]|uniref:Heterokaryon incompatibility domain-containing protein n=1 Tax=Diplocarpon coronariae TaxID=2795749 RepID=A0A218ZDL8_9HELO|nr:hypothetical protein B2J93_1749 [Marssonina coronariae]
MDASALRRAYRWKADRRLRFPGPDLFVRFLLVFTPTSSTLSPPSASHAPTVDRIALSYENQYYRPYHRFFAGKEGTQMDGVLRKWQDSSHHPSSGAHQNTYASPKAPRDSESTFLLRELEDLMGREFFNTLPERRKLTFYASLPNNQTIRLLTLEAGFTDEPLRGSLTQVPIDALPPYEALSYCWGSPDQPCSINLEGGSMPITHSLHSALVRLRRRSRSRRIWADALCINQADNAEKSEQILLMPQIYSLAFSTLAYLGEEADDSDTALELHEKLGGIDFSALPEKSVTIEWLEGHGLPRYQDPAWVAWQAFWRRPWFRRAWVLQEFVLGKDIVMICGRKKMGWRKFVSATEKMQEFNLMKWSASAEDTFDSIDEAHAGPTSMLAMMGVKSSTNLSSGIAYYIRSFSQADASTLHQLDSHSHLHAKLPMLKDTIMMCREDPTLVEPVIEVFENIMRGFGLDEPPEPVRLPLIHLLFMFDRSQATDPRDRLFALLGLASDTSSDEYQPDYSEPVESVAQRFATGFIQNGHAMKVLLLAGLSDTQPNFPSWAPDWTKPGVMERRLLCARSLWAPSFSYRAATDTTPSVRFGEKPGVLVVSGSRFDAIARVGMDASGLSSRESSDIFLLKPFFLEADEFMYPSRYKVYVATGEDMFEVHWRTLIGNKGMNSAEIVPDDYARQYEQCRSFFDSTDSISSIEQLLSLNLYYGCMVGIICRYRLCVTSSGLVGLVPMNTQVGDTICLFNGGAMPFIIRPSSEMEGAFRLIGGCYIHGMMEGEALRSPAWHEQEFNLH